MNLETDTASFSCLLHPAIRIGFILSILGFTRGLGPKARTGQMKEGNLCNLYTNSSHQYYLVNDQQYVQRPTLKNAFIP